MSEPKNLIEESVKQCIAPIMECVMDLVNMIDRISYVALKGANGPVSYDKQAHALAMNMGEMNKILKRMATMQRSDLEILLEVLNGCQDKRLILGDMAAGLVSRIRREKLPVCATDNKRVVTALAEIVRDSIIDRVQDNN